jgi:hypothetical protein
MDASHRVDTTHTPCDNYFSEDDKQASGTYRFDMAYEMSVEPRETLPHPLFASRREDSEFLEPNPTSVRRQANG